MAHPLRVVLAALYWDYGQKRRGLSPDYYNLYLTLKGMFDTRFFDFHSLMLEKGKEAMNEELRSLIERERPDLTIFALFQDEFIPEVIEALQQYTTTLCYFWDDIWRIDYADFWAPRFNYVTTASSHRLRQYRQSGPFQAIYSPFAFNGEIYQRRKLPKQFDVSFVGGSHPYRAWIIKQLRRAGVRVHVWGGGTWGTGKIDQDEMVNVFNQTRINLNISNSVHWDLRYLVSSWRAVQVTLRSRKNRESLKARHFEICGCGGFQLTNYVEDLERCYAIGTEVAVYLDVDDLIDKIRYYLQHEDEREAIAEAGYRRALAEHTYQARFTEIAERIFGPGAAEDAHT